MLIRTRLSLLYSLSSTALAGLIIASFVILLMNIVNSFNKRMFSSEGYLTFTLPVSVDNLLIGKLIVNMVWYLFTTFTIALSIACSSIPRSVQVFPSCWNCSVKFS